MSEEKPQASYGDDLDDFGNGPNAPVHNSNEPMEAAAKKYEAFAKEEPMKKEVPEKVDRMPKMDITKPAPEKIDRMPKTQPQPQPSKKPAFKLDSIKIPERFKDKRVLTALGVVLGLGLVIWGLDALVGRNGSGSHQAPAAEENAGNEGAVLGAVFEAMRVQSSYAFEGDISLKVSVGNAAGASDSVAYESAHKGVRAQEGGATASYTSTGFGMKLDQAGQQSETMLTVETVATGAKRYLRLGQAAGIAEGALADVLNARAGRWYAVSDEQKREFFDRVEASVGFWSADDVEALGMDFAFGDMVKSAQVLGEEESGGAAVMHYQLGLDGDRAIAGLLELLNEPSESGAAAWTDVIAGAAESGVAESAAAGESAAGGTAGAPVDGATAAPEDITGFADALLGKITVEIWAGKTDNLVRRMRLSGSFDREDYRELAVRSGSAAAEGEMPELRIDFTADYIFSGFGTAAVREPQDAPDFDEVLTALGQTASAGPAASPVDAAPATPASGTNPAEGDADGDGLADGLEAFFGTDPSQADTDGDGYRDGEEVDKGYDPAVAGSARLDFAKLGSAQ